MLSLHNTHHEPGVERSISESADHTGVGGLGIWADLGRWYKLWTFQVKFRAACNVTPVTSFESKTNKYIIFICFWLDFWFFVSLCQMAKAGGTPCNLLSRKRFGGYLSRLLLPERFLNDLQCCHPFLKWVKLVQCNMFEYNQDMEAHSTSRPLSFFPTDWVTKFRWV